MTYEELLALPFRMDMHFSFEDYHSTVYKCADDRYDIYACDIQPYKPNERAQRRWKINGKICKTKKQLLEAIKEL